MPPSRATLSGAGAVAGVRESVGRVVEAADRQREALERDLHDGVQQRLVALRIRLALAGELVNGDARLRATLADIGDGLDAAIDELREVAHGIYPTVLAEHGLTAALSHVARACASPVEVVGTEVARHPPELELAIYYCCREAIQNASKHGGSSVHVQVSLHEDANKVGFVVCDDGPGFDVAGAPAAGGLEHMRDRIDLVGGRLSIISRAGAGTVVSAAIALSDAGAISHGHSALARV